MGYEDELSDVFSFMQRQRMGQARLDEALEYLLPLVHQATDGHEVEHLVIAVALHFEVHPKLLHHELLLRRMKKHREHHDHNVIRQSCTVCHGLYHRSDEIVLEIVQN